MRLSVASTVLLGSVVCFGFIPEATTVAQSTTSAGSLSFPAQSQTGGTSLQRPGSGAINAPATPVGLDGFCAVCIVETRKWVKGDSKFAVRLDGRDYLFPGQQQKDMFLKNPLKYTPALSGDCIVSAVQERVRKPGTVYFTALHKDRLFLFSDAKSKSIFLKNPEKYENADLVTGGMCVVCKVEMQKDVLGAQQFGTMYGGMRFLFPGNDQKKMFLANPSKYMPKN